MWSLLPEDSGHLSEPRGGVSLEFEDEKVCGRHVLVSLHLGQLLLAQLGVLIHHKEHTPSAEEGRLWLVTVEGRGVIGGV